MSLSPTHISLLLLFYTSRSLFSSLLFHSHHHLTSINSSYTQFQTLLPIAPCHPSLQLPTAHLHQFLLFLIPNPNSITGYKDKPNTK